MYSINIIKVFDDIVDRVLGYSPKIEIKPVHLANGLFRAVHGEFLDKRDMLVQHKAFMPSHYPKASDIPEFLQKNKLDRQMLHMLLSADKAVFKDVNFSSYTLTHATHITSDNHDRGTGRWLRAILENENGGGQSKALKLLKNLLVEPDSGRSDEISVLTLPLVKDSKKWRQVKLYEQQEHPGSLATDSEGNFCDPLLNSICKGFDCLADFSDMPNAGRVDKLSILHRLVTWACFCVYLHLTNSGFMDERMHGDSPRRVPMLFCVTERPASTLKVASRHSRYWVRRSIDLFFRRQILQYVRTNLVNEKINGKWCTDEARQRIDSIEWRRRSGGMKKTKGKIAEFPQKCRDFFDSYHTTAGQSPDEAFANAVTDMFDSALSSKPWDVARSLGTRIALLSPTRRPNHKLYTPRPSFLEVLVRASISQGTEMPLADLAEEWHQHYGILFGALGNENEILEEWDIHAVDREEYSANVDALARLLEMSGYARRYADGVVIVEVKR